MSHPKVPPTQTWFIVDCEAQGPSCSTGRMTQFGIVLFDEPPFNERFHGIMTPPGTTTMQYCLEWVQQFTRPKTRAVFVSDNPAFDWQWMNDAFHVHLGANPFGWSARRIGDLHSGLMRNPRSGWKQLRVTRHDHHPVHDAVGNAEALWAILGMMETPNPPTQSPSEGH